MVSHPYYMPIEIQRNRSKWFYGRTVINGRRLSVNLAVKIEGNPPASLLEVGDPPFERSRARAEVAYERWESELKQRGKSEEILQRIHEVRTGTRAGSIPLAEMADRWKSLPRRRKIAVRYAALVVADFNRFIKFITHLYPSVKEMADVQDAMARRFMAGEEDRRVSPKRYNDVLKLLRSVFSRLRKEAALASNPFEGIPTKESDTIHRMPFSAEEITDILRAAKDDPFIEPLIVLAVCTAMRLGDCARITWEHVDLARGFVDVKSAKTKKLVTIPFSRCSARCWTISRKIGPD